MGTHPATTFIDVRHPRRVAAGPVAAGVVVEDADILGTADSGECLAGSSRPLVLAAVTIGGRAEQFL